MAEETKKTIPETPVAEEPTAAVVEKEAPPQPEAEKAKNAESASFKKESKKVDDDLIESEKQALDEFKLLIQEALNKHEFTTPPTPKTDEKIEPCEALEKVEEKVKETIVVKVSTAAPPEEVSIWGVPLLSDSRSDVILLKFLSARYFEVEEAFTMLKDVVAWREEFKIDQLLEEECIDQGLEKVVYIHGVDKEGRLVSYHAFGEFQDKDLCSSTFSDAEKRAKFLRFYIQFVEKTIRKLDFNPGGISTIVLVIDRKNSGSKFKKELRQATNQALQLLHDNYPEFVAKQVLINASWWHMVPYRMISPLLTQRIKSRFAFARPNKTAETLFRYIAPEHVPVQYGGLNKKGDQEFSPVDAATEDIIMPTCKHTIELPISKAGTLVWEVRVVGWDVFYGAEFVPSAKGGGYTWIVQEPRKIGPTDEQVLSCSFKIGEPGKVVLTFINKTSKKKQLVYRSKTKVL